MNKCRHCGRSFQPTPHQIKKYDWSCGPCRRRTASEYRAARLAAGRPVKSGKASPEWKRAYNMEYARKPEVKARQATLARERRRNPLERHKHEARWCVNRAIASGKLTRQPCEQCGNPKSEAHHPDYSRPLDVAWLCRTHHKALHAAATGEA
jgi:hypothetical protein